MEQVDSPQQTEANRLSRNGVPLGSAAEPRIAHCVAGSCFESLPALTVPSQAFAVG